MKRSLTDAALALALASLPWWVACAPSVSGGSPPAPPADDVIDDDDPDPIGSGGGGGAAGTVQATGGASAGVSGTGGMAGMPMPNQGGSGGNPGNGGSNGMAGASGTGGTTSMGPAVDTRPVVSAEVSGFRLMVRRRDANGSTSAPAAFDMRGISYSPAERGGGQPTDDVYTRWAAKDFALMRDGNINTIKTYRPVSRALLDQMLAHGIVAAVTVLNRAGDDFASAVRDLKDHPAVLMWIVGNEWNWNNLYGSCEGGGCYDRIEQVARAIKGMDPNHPVATSFAPMGELPTADDLRRLPSVDVWGLNIYSQPGFFGRFTNYRTLAQTSGIRKPIFFSEYGADAYDNGRHAENQDAHAMALQRQTAEIRAQLSARNPDLPCLGGTPFEWSDEWWKSGNPGGQEPGGFPNIGVAFDQFANEEWWGIVDIDRKPRKAYFALKEIYAR